MSVWKGGVWGSQKFPGGSGVWKGGAWLSQRSATATQVLRNLLFGSGQQGAFFVPQPTVDGQPVLYQDSAGTTPVTADGQPVGLMLDISGNGNHATQSTAASKPLYRTDGTLHWLEFDGVDDEIVATYSSAVSQPATLVMALLDNLGQASRVYFTGSAFSTRHQLASNNDGFLAVNAGENLSSTESPPASKIILGAIINTTNSSLRRNKQEIASGYAGANISSVGKIGGLYVDGYNSEINCYGLIHVEGGDIDQSETYLATLAGVTL